MIVLAQCVQRWNRSLRPDIIKGRWRPKEDNILIELVRSYSEIKAIPWTNVAMKIPGRTSKQCRERWFNFLDPSLKRRVQWSEDEDKKLLELGKQLGCKWSLMSRQLPGRTANAVKVRYYALERHELSNKRDTANCDDESDTASTPITPIPSETTSEAQDSVDSMPPLSASVSNDSHIWNSDPQIWSTFQANTTQEVNPMFQYYINQFQPFLYNGGSEPFLTNVDANITYHQFRQQNALGINVHFHIQAQIDQLKLQLMYLKQLQDQCPN